MKMAKNNVDCFVEGFSIREYNYKSESSRHK